MRLRSDLQRLFGTRAWFTLALLLGGSAACGSITGAGDGGGGATGAAGTTGSAGSTGSAGTSGGAGTTGTAGTSGTAGAVGGGGATGGAGRGGTTGAGGVTGAGGRGGTTGAGGVTGAGGRGGTTGAGGVTGAGGRGGTTGAGGLTGAGGRGGTTGAAGASGAGGRGGGGGASGAGGTGQSCGNGATCTVAQFCDWTSNRCGTVDMAGSCQARPQACSAIYAPVCACDGKVYSSECDANGSGQDVSDTVTCTPPTGMFACGHIFCSNGTQYCQATLGGAVDNAGSYVCQPLPAACNGTPTCACITGAQCGNCKMTAGGEVMTSCLVP